MNLPKNAIVTSVSALAQHKLISFSPAKLYLEMPLGTNVSKYDDFIISTQSLDTIRIGLDKTSEFPIYSIERIFVELNKFPLENTIKEEAKKNLEKLCNPSVVKKIYEQLKNKRRGLDDQYIQEYLNQNYENIIELILNTIELKRKDILREYLIALVSSINVPILIKGGSSIELFSEIKRSTHDVDTHSDGKNIHNILKIIGNPKHEIYFKPTKASLELLTKDKLVYKLSLMPKTSSVKLKDYFKKIGEYANMEISFNTAFTNKELNDIIDEFKLSKRQLVILKKHTCMPFSREMLLAEKFQSIIGKPENTKRTKDLIDLKLLFSDFDEKLFLKWFFKKFETQREAKDHQSAKKLVNANVEKELSHIKPNFNDAIKMYGLDFSYEECLAVYKELASIIINSK